jgi:hypothetical protein
MPDEQRDDDEHGPDAGGEEPRPHRRQEREKDPTTTTRPPISGPTEILAMLTPGLAGRLPGMPSSSGAPFPRACWAKANPAAM